MTTPALDAAREVVARYLSLKQLLANIGDDQWRPGHSPTAKEDTTERSKGMTSDPTPSIVADPRRLALRAEVIDAENALVQAADVLAKAEQSLNEVYEKWLGNH